ncbi:hypothetical protein A6B38_00035 [Bartonella bacilliformis]|uniref:Uncharacterized protein n=1 Tax=Bartonella bacilliformis INS TaxID=1206782 RepID=A0ABN0IHV4_BARBA|nr:hypothetical protein AL467_01115 [Bartonella bacilliformis]EKS46093.1 hypothetical protein BbINS_00985 [Bartonella bacilliformis INS]KZN22101.1 hypothetical protein A6B38_00035 [Bartonella bacilliformis]
MKWRRKLKDEQCGERCAEWDASEGGIFVKGARAKGKCSWGNMSEVSESCRGRGVSGEYWPEGA